MPSLRQALSNHLETVRGFSIRAIRIDSGIYDVNQLKTIIQEPEAIVQWESAWINELTEALQILQRYASLIERWANHVYGLEHNLGIKKVDEARVLRGEVSAIKLLATKTFDNDYLRWVLTDTVRKSSEPV